MALKAGVPCLPGTFAAVPGPNLPTRAEYRFLRRIGADLVGITQLVQTESVSPVSIESMLDAADLAGPRMGSMLVGVIATLAS